MNRSPRTTALARILLVARAVRAVTYLAFAGMALVFASGCTHVPENKKAVMGFDVRGVHAVDVADLEAKLATRETSRLLGIFPGAVFEYETYDRYALQEDVARIERFYRARGYYAARVRVARVIDLGDDRVRIEVQIDEGEPVRVAKIELAFKTRVPDDVRAAVERKSGEAFGRPPALFDEDKLAAAEASIVRALGDHGYPDGAVSRSADVDLVKNEATVSMLITSGEPAVFGDVSFEGLESIPEDIVRRAFAVTPGSPYSTSELESGRQALLDLGVFATADVEAVTGARSATGVVPVKVKVTLAKLHTLRVGGGLELSSSRADVHALIGWRGENALGGLRHVELTAKPGLALWPTNLTNIGTSEGSPEKLLFFQRTRALVRRPAFVEARTTGIATLEYAVYPQLFPQKTDNVIGYHEVGASGAVQRAFGPLFARPGYGVQANFPFNVVGRSPEHLDAVIVSYLELFSYLDFRDDALRPTRGLYFANTLQFAGGPLGGTADDLRLQPEARAYVPLTRRISFAVRAGVGFLFPRNYGDAAKTRFKNEESAATVDRAALSRDYQTLFFRGLVSGGPSSNRGYALRDVGPHDTIPYLIPSVAAAQAALSCKPGSPNPPPECLLPTGGLSQWESSVELRFKIAGPVLAATFCDAGDVSAEPTNLRFDRLHLSCGAGGRYDTPVGPIRLDVGVRLPGLQTLGSSFGEGVPAELLGAPIAISFGIGEAF